MALPDIIAAKNRYRIKKQPVVETGWAILRKKATG
jgi:hypothetical protein